MTGTICCEFIRRTSEEMSSSLVSFPIQASPIQSGQPDMTIIKYGSDEEDIVRRLLTALVSQWDELPPAVQDLLLRKACLGFKPASATASLREQIKVFIQKHGAATRKNA